MKPASLAPTWPPPAVSDTRGPDEVRVNQAYQTLSEFGLKVELLTAYDGDTFAFSCDLRRYILVITAIHPLRESALRALVKKSGGDMTLADALIPASKLKAVDHAGTTFYVRRLTKLDA